MRIYGAPLPSTVASFKCSATELSYSQDVGSAFFRFGARTVREKNSRQRITNDWRQQSLKRAPRTSRLIRIRKA
jgi:hypothetical protein